MLTGPSKRVLGKITKLTDGVCTFKPMVLDTKVNGLRIDNTAREKRLGQMELCLKVLIKMERKVDSGVLSGPVAIGMRGSSKGM